MYHPYFRGKQYELITVRENAHILAKAKFVPIIEPVKEALSGLQRTLDAVCDAGGNAVVIVNPHHGVLAEDAESITSLLKDGYLKKTSVSAGVLLTKYMTLKDALECCKAHSGHQLSLIHAGFPDAKALADALAGQVTPVRHVFFEKHCTKLYRRHFAEKPRILLRDGFERRKNREYPKLESFSDLHVTFPDESMEGFGDFLIVGDEFSESGGPAYAVAIHLTFIDDDKDNEMFIYHFVSKTQDTPTDPAGKFAEALDLMIKTLDEPSSKVLESEAVKEFRELHKKKHFPGLGYVKKLSMKHHIETLAAFFE
jgi:hypothetical protein